MNCLIIMAFRIEKLHGKDMGIRADFGFKLHQTPIDSLLTYKMRYYIMKLNKTLLLIYIDNRDVKRLIKSEQMLAVHG